MPTNTKGSIQARLQSRIHKRAAKIRYLQGCIKLYRDLNIYTESSMIFTELRELEEMQKLDKAIMRRTNWC